MTGRSVKQKYFLLLERQRDSSVMVFGSSRAKESIRPDVLTDVLINKRKLRFTHGLKPDRVFRLLENQSAQLIKEIRELSSLNQKLSFNRKATKEANQLRSSCRQENRLDMEPTTI